MTSNNEATSMMLWKRHDIRPGEVKWTRDIWTVEETAHWVGGCIQSRWCARYRDPATGRKGHIRTTNRKELSKWNSVRDARNAVDRVLAGLSIGTREVV